MSFALQRFPRVALQTLARVQPQAGLLRDRRVTYEVFKRYMTSLPSTAGCSAPMRFPEVNDAEARSKYWEAINIRNDDPLITIEDLINKGFAYLDYKGLFTWSACECFQIADGLDKERKYQKIIECGINQTRHKESSKPCLHVV